MHTVRLPEVIGDLDFEFSHILSRLLTLGIPDLQQPVDARHGDHFAWRKNAVLPGYLDKTRGGQFRALSSQRHEGIYLLISDTPYSPPVSPAFRE